MGVGTEKKGVILERVKLDYSRSKIGWDFMADWNLTLGFRFLASWCHGPGQRMQGQDQFVGEGTRCSHLRHGESGLAVIA